MSLIQSRLHYQPRQGLLTLEHLLQSPTALHLLQVGIVQLVVLLLVLLHCLHQAIALLLQLKDHNLGLHIDGVIGAVVGRGSVQAMAQQNVFLLQLGTFRLCCVGEAPELLCAYTQF